MSVTFHNRTGTLVRRVQLGGTMFLEQFGSRGWFGYHAPAAFVHTENQIDVHEAVSRLQGIRQERPERLRAECMLYEFDLRNILLVTA